MVLGLAQWTSKLKRLLFQRRNIEDTFEIEDTVIAAEFGDDLFTGGKSTGDDD